MGRRPQGGPNLFHSFDRFDVGTSDTARFTAANPKGIVNILSRVTGEQRSHIDGRIQSDIAGANVFLLNPSGVLFGPNATLDVQGSLHVSTADVLRFTDGTVLQTGHHQAPMLTTAPLAAFGFVHANPAGIAMQGGALRAPPGKTLSVVGGNIEVSGSALHAQSGQVSMASVASAGEVGLSPVGQLPDVDVDTFERLGDIAMTDGTHVSIRGSRGGTVVIRGGRLLVDNAFIDASTRGNVAGAKVGINVDVRGKVVVTNGASLRTDADKTGDAGDIRIKAGSLRVEAASFIGSRAFSNGDGGNIRVEASAVTVTNGAQIGTNTFPFGSGRGGRGGNVTVQATDTVQLVGEGSIFANTTGPGPAGSITVEAGAVRVREGAEISSDTSGSGAGGQVTVRADGTVQLARGAHCGEYHGARPCWQRHGGGTGRDRDGGRGDHQRQLWDGQWGPGNRPRR